DRIVPGTGIEGEATTTFGEGGLDIVAIVSAPAIHCEGRLRRAGPGNGGSAAARCARRPARGVVRAGVRNDERAGCRVGLVVKGEVEDVIEIQQGAAGNVAQVVGRRADVDVPERPAPGLRIDGQL